MEEVEVENRKRNKELSEKDLIYLEKALERFQKEYDSELVTHNQRKVEIAEDVKTNALNEDVMIKQYQEIIREATKKQLVVTKEIIQLTGQTDLANASTGNSNQSLPGHYIFLIDESGSMGCGINNALQFLYNVFKKKNVTYFDCVMHYFRQFII